MAGVSESHMSQMSQPDEQGHKGQNGAEAEPELSRDLGFFAVFTTATGTMIGAGIFVLPGVAAEGAGPGAALSFLLAGAIAGVAAICVCELATAMPKAGGTYYFVSRSMGPVVGSMVGLGGWLSLILKGSFALVGLGQYVIYFSPVPILVTAVAAGVLLVLVNLLGARISGLLQNVVVFALLGILLVFVAKGLLAVDLETMRPLLPFGWDGVFRTTGVVFISYLGIVKAASLAEEVHDPSRNLPLGILASVAVVTVLYVGTMLVVTGVLPIPEIAAAATPLSDAGALFLGAAGGAIVAIAGLLATLSTGNAAVLSSARYPFAMARDGLMTRWISKTHRRFRTPARAIVVTGVIMLVLVVLLDVEGLAKLGAVFGILVFALVNISVVVLRWTSPEWYRPTFRTPLVPILPIAGALAALSLIPQLGLLSHVSAVAFVVVGVGWYLWHRRVAEKGGRVIEPEYGFADRMQEIQQHWALAEKQRSREEAERAAEGVPAEGEVAPAGHARAPAVVAVLEEERPNKHLLALAAATAKRYDASVEALLVTEVPMQSPLTGPVPSPSRWWMDKLRKTLDLHPVPAGFHHLMARDRARGILSFAVPGVKLILLDWHEEFRKIKLRGSYVDRVLRRSPVRLGVLKYRGHKKYERILVATAGGPYAPAEVEIADALATYMDSRLTFLMVLPPDASDHRETQAREYLERLDELTDRDAELQVARGERVSDEILAAGADYDLIVLGATRQPTLRHIFGRHLVGPIADEIAERADGSVLVTRDPGAASRLSSRLQRWGLRIRKWLPGSRPDGGLRGPERLPEAPQVELFPREDPKRR